MLAAQYETIVCEDLNVAGLTRNRRLARAISDQGFGAARRMLAYKATWSGGQLILADRFYPSSKTCSACGAVKAKLRLTERVFTCDDDACARVQDRDRMAHRHAHAEGISSYVARTGRFTPTARGGQVSLVRLDQHSPVKREASSDASQRGDPLAPAA